MTRKQTLLAIAHEMVHVKQYAKGELKDYLKEEKSKYKNDHIYFESLNYWDYPWEIEAHGRELGLYYRFIMKLREEDKVKRVKNAKL
jgi:hypothetical protein